MFEEIKSRFNPDKNLPFSLSKVLSVKAGLLTMFNNTETEKKNVNPSQMSKDRLEFGIEFKERQNLAKLEVKYELVKHFFNTNDSELEQIDAVNEFETLYKMIEKARPATTSFFGLKQKEEVQESDPIQMKVNTPTVDSPLVS